MRTRNHRSGFWTPLLATLGLLLTSSGVAVLVANPAANADHGHKAFVCKYVGTPGVDERLQTGQNPIEVNSHDVQDKPVGTFFDDAQGRSVVIDDDVAPQDPEPTIEDCPAPPPPPPTEVTAAAPTFRNPTCPNPTAAVVLPTTEGVTFSQSGPAAPGATVTVTAVAQEGFVLVGQSSWQHTFTQVPTNCAQVNPPNPPIVEPPAPKAPRPPAVAPPAVAPPVTPSVISAGVVPASEPIGTDYGPLGLAMLASGLVLLMGAGARSLARSRGGR